MKKLLLSGVAVLAVAAATPAHAEIDMTVGGFFKGYGAFVDQDETAGASVHDFDIIRHTEAHVGGETTLDNGLTVGFHVESEIDGVDASGIEESYVYMSGTWGRINFGAEDGAAYLLQVAAPSADSNVDGLRTYVQPVNYAAEAGTLTGAVSFDYENNLSGYTDKITYLTPVLSGFQAGLSYTPDLGSSGQDFSGVSLDDQATDLGSVMEVSARYEGEYEGVGLAIGAGWAQAEAEGATPTNTFGNAGTDDQTKWNAGIDLDFAGFGIGVVYTEDDAADAGDDEETLVVGADYTTGAFKIGASWFDQENSFGVAGLDTERYTGGVVYTYGPGMTFRGSVSFIEHDADGASLTSDTEATSVLIGTDIKF